MRGPYHTWEYKPNKWKQIGLVAGGTGITPMLPIARTVLSSPEDSTSLHLTFCNSTEEDILLKEALEGMTECHKERYHLHHVISHPARHPSTLVPVLTGRITKDYLKQTVPPVSKDTCILVCGPHTFMTSVTELLSEIGFSQDQIHAFD